MSNNIETFSFSADINQLLSLIINTFYTNKDIVIRELISNASDALNKIRYESLTDRSVLGDEENLHINISFDKTNRVLIISDTGIGMTKNDLINNLGTIAKSGTKSFIEQLTKSNNDINMIGQFGVGFYSAYLIANKVDVISKNNNDETYCWTSEAGGSFNIISIEDSPIKRGTSIHLHLKEDMDDYLDCGVITNIIKRYSQYVDFPIYVQVIKTKTIEVDDEEVETDENKTDSEEVKVEEVKVEEKKKKTIEEKYEDFDLVNTSKPIWTKSPDEITREEYSYLFISFNTHNYGDYLEVSHFHIEGNIEYKAILFIPERPPLDMFDTANKVKSSIKLYVRRVFITDTCYELLPDYLKFICGVVDSDDMPLNISRETLQQNKIIKMINKSLVKKCFDLFTKIAEDEDRYIKFYKNFSKNIKLGVHDDSTNRLKLAKFLRYETNKSNGKMISYEQYIENMKENQKCIYYIIGESINTVQNSAFTELLTKYGYEIIYMTEPIDEYLVNSLREYEGKKLINITKEKLELDEVDKDELENLKKDFKNLTDFIKTTLDTEVESVEISNRLENSPCVLVTNEYGLTANMQRIMKAQALNTNTLSYDSINKKILEINPNNKIIISLNKRFQDQENNISKDVIWLLYEMALINSGFTLTNNKAFSNRIHKLISFGLDIEDDNIENNDDNIIPENNTNKENNEENNMEQVD